MRIQTMKFILGTKINMTQYFADNGQVTPVTVVAAGPVTVTEVKTTERDGYQAVRVGYGVRKTKNVSKAVRGQLKDLATDKEIFAVMREFPMDGEPKVGDKVEVSTFAEGDVVEVSGITKSKGFQGVVKRHGFSGGPRSHGQKHSEREPGSIGSTARQRVIKGLRMAGRMGGERVTVKNLKIVKVDPENNYLYISGAIPGRRGTMLEIIAK
jgi:large subunit ribosomal protein L3